MRIIAGSAKGRKLKMVPGDTTRPITDRTKEALFSILGRWIIEARVLDLFGGTGAVGIEALSRGAQHVTFIEQSGKAIRTIHDNLEIAGVADRARVERNDAFKYLQTPPAQPFDLIYVAPPQYKELWAQAIQTVDDNLAAWLLPDGAVIAQIHPREYADLSLKQLYLYDERKYGSTLLCFYENITLQEK